MKTLKIVLILALLPMISLAEESSNARLERLEKEVQDLKAEKAKESKPSESTLANWYDLIQIGGYLDMSYTYNFNRQQAPAAGLPAVNPMRVYDTNANGFRFNTFEMVFQNNPERWPAWLGFRVDVDVGQDAQAYTAAGFTVDDIELQQGYVSMTAPLVNGLNLRVGKWVTLLGAEVIESKDNFNFSRSFLFGFAQPTTHLGLLMTYPVIKDKVSVSAGVVNGWDKVNKTNHAPTYIGQVFFTPVRQFNFAVNGIAGPEDSFGIGNDSQYRGVLDLVATIKPTERLTFLLNYDWGQESKAIFYMGAAPRHAAWQGFSGIVAYDFCTWYQAALRGEYFRDPDGYRTLGQLQPFLPVSPFYNHNYMWEITVTNTFTIYKNLKARMEYRHDQSNQPVFVKGAIPVDYQNTVSGDLMFSF